MHLGADDRLAGGDQAQRRRRQRPDAEGKHGVIAVGELREHIAAPGQPQEKEFAGRLVAQNVVGRSEGASVFRPLDTEMLLRQRLPNEASFLPPVVMVQVAEGELGPALALLEAGVPVLVGKGLGSVIRVPENPGPGRDMTQCRGLIPGVGDLQIPHQHRRAVHPGDHLHRDRADLVLQLHHGLFRAGPRAGAAGGADKIPAVVQRLAVHLEFEGVDRPLQRVQPRQAGQDILAVDMTAGGPVQPDPAAVFKRLLAHGGVRDITSARPGG